MQQLFKEFKSLFRVSKSLLLQVLLIALSSYAGNAGATVVVLGVLGWNLSKNKFSDAFILFLVLLLFSDSSMNLFSTPGKAKDFAALLMSFFIFFKTPNALSKSYFSYFLPYLFIALLGLVFINFRLIGLQKLVSYGLLLILIPTGLISILSKPGDRAFLAKLLFIFAVLYAFSIFMSRINPQGYATFGRFNGIHRNPNGVGIFSTLFIMNIFLIKDKYPTLFSKKFYYALLGLFVFSIVLAGSRNAMMSLGVFFLFRSIKVKFFAGLALVIVIASGYGFITYFIETLLIEFGLAEELRLDTLSYASGRIYIWEACLLEIQNSYWLGHGFTYEEYSKWDQKYYEIIPMLIHNYGNIHQSYLTIWLNTGLLGLVSFLLGLISLVFKTQRSSPTIAPMFFAALLLGFFESYMVASLNPYTWQLWFGFTVAAVVPRVLASKMSKKRTVSQTQNITEATIDKPL